MSLSAFLPSQLRVSLRSLLKDARSMSLLNSRLRPVYTARHTPDELNALRAAAAQARDARLHRPPPTTNTHLRATVRRLTVRQVLRPTFDAVTVVFDNLKTDPVVYSPGQFLTLVVNIDQREARRAYSICSDPAERDTVAITVKRVRGGLVSNWINDHVAPGDAFTTLGPSGTFGTDPDPERARRVILVGGGSGITPLMSILKALLRNEPRSHLHLTYANRSTSSIIFHEELTRLEHANADRLKITHVLETPPDDWTGLIGLLAGGVLTKAVPIDSKAEYYLCGPEAMMAQVTAYLTAADIPGAQVHLERFTAQLRPDTTVGHGLVHSVRFSRSNLLLQVPDHQTLLEAGHAAGVPLEFSCTMGGCAACKIQIISGEVVHDEPNCLTLNEKTRGNCLACIARPRSAMVIDA